jgi:hypothetical protein
MKSTCPFCKTEFQPATKVQKFCCISCRINAKHRKIREAAILAAETRKENRGTMVCKKCGVSFLTDRANKVFCSSTCQIAFHGYQRKTNKEVKCRVCGNTFQTNRNGTICSDFCRRELSVAPRLRSSIVLGLGEWGCEP